LEISLGLTDLESPKWHAYLVIHEPNEISKEGVDLGTYEFLLSRRTKQVHFPGPNYVVFSLSLFFTPWGRKVKKSEIEATAKLLNPLHKATHEELIDAVYKIVANVEESEIPPVGDFQNCLDLAVEAVRLLWEGEYVTKDDYEAFKKVKDKISAATRKDSDDVTRELIAKGRTGNQLNKGHK
ncbi:hypothetical protein H0H93_007781, partial [Arthromyces matolae]